MDRAWQRYLDVAGGITQVTRNRAEQVVRTLVKRGEIAAERTEKAVDELLRRSEQNRRALAGIIRSETERAVARIGAARQADVDRLERKVARLEERQATTAGAAPARKASRKATKKASKKAAKKASSKRAAKATRATKKSASKKSTAKKSTAKKSTAKKSTAKKSATKKSSPGGGGS